MEAISIFLRTLALFLLVVWVALIDLDRLLSNRGFAVFHGLLFILAALSLTIAYNL